MSNFNYFYQGWTTDHFEPLQTLLQYIKNLARPEGFLGQHEIAWIIELGAAMAKCPWWEGDFNGGVYVFPVGTPNEVVNFEVAVMWKQSNNGTTFCVSPCSIPWLSEYEIWPDIEAVHK